MKKAVITLLIIMIISFAITIILSGLFFSNSKELEKMNITVEQQKDIELSEAVDNIVIDSGVANKIDIHYTDEGKIKTELKGKYTSLIKKDIEIYSKDRTDSLEIEAKTKGIQRFINLGDYKTELELIVYIPRTYSKQIEIGGAYDTLNVDAEVKENVTVKK